MKRALELASLGLGHVSPNPLVGCVIVQGGRIIGEGWHQRFGGPHAEVNAIQQVADLSLLPEATVYVNLEPCSHVGKTPPCADLLVEKKVRRVVIANGDPNPQVAGKGISRLHSAGIEVTEGILEQEGRWLNRRFLTNMETRLPYVILKWAEDAEGMMASSDQKPVWISNERSRQRVHQWRTEEDAVLVGARTAEMDDPQLNVRDWTGRNPVRIVLDPALRLPTQLHLFDRSVPTLFYNCQKSTSEENLERIQVPKKGFLAAVLRDLLIRNVGSVMVEGGAFTLQGFLDAGLWHEARIFRSATRLPGGIKAPRLNADEFMTDRTTGDVLSIYRNPKPATV